MKEGILLLSENFEIYTHPIIFFMMLLFCLLLVIIIVAKFGNGNVDGMFDGVDFSDFIDFD